jgi:hypothetical protein
MMMMMSPRNENDVGSEIRSEEESVKRKRQPWTKKISTSLEKQILNGSERLHHRYAYLVNDSMTPADRVLAKT